MSFERSTKRRRLNPISSATTGQSRSSQHTLETKASNVHTSALHTPDDEVKKGRGSTTLHDHDIIHAIDSTPSTLRRRKQADTSRRLTIEDSEDEEASGEIVVRSSGRARRLPAKLQEDDHILASRAGLEQRSRTATTAGSVRNMALKGTQKDTCEPDTISAPSTRKKRRAAKVGKENVTPPDTVSRGATTGSISHADKPASAVDAIGSGLTKLQKRPKSREQSVLAPETTEIEEADTLDTRDDARMIPPDQLRQLQNNLLTRVTGRQSIPQVDREDAHTKVASLVKQAIESGESNSMLLIGPRGTGKTALVDQILRAQQATHSEDFHVVRLNGFIHTDDKLALRDIWRQLGRDMELEDKETNVRSYADTLSMLLALLSRSQDLDQSANPDQISKSVIFVLDEFDLFATHPRQTLLYNLFDIAQSRKAPIAVLGLTTRVDVVEALEKRVKSRFSHRYVHLAPAKSLTAFTKICKATLMVADGSYAQDAVATWNAAMESLFESEYLPLHIRKIFYRSRSIPDFLTTMLMPLGLLPTGGPLSANEVVEHFLSTTSMSSLGPDSKLDVLPSLSTLQLAMLICAARQNAIYSTENIGFNVAYEEYKAIAGKAKLQATASGALSAGGRIWGKDVAKNAWADLVKVGLIMEDGRGIGKVDIALEEIAGSGVELGQWSRWCKEI